MRAGLFAFVRRMLAFALLFMGLLLSVAIAGPPLTGVDFTAALGKKHARLEGVPAPRVVLIGGSNASFGVNSEALENAFHRPVVNMALHGGLGYRFMVNEVIDSLERGDLLLAILEHTQYERPDKQQGILYEAIELYPRALLFLPVMDRPKVAMTFAVRKLQMAADVVFGEKVKRTHPIYFMDGFNERGDLVSHLGRRSPGLGDVQPAEGITFAVDPLFWRITAELLERAREQGFTVAFAWPSLAASAENAVRDRDLARQLRAHGLTVIGEPADYVFPDALFFDTKYHLMAEGRELRTARLIDDARSSLAPEFFER